MHPQFCALELVNKKPVHKQLPPGTKINGMIGASQDRQHKGQDKSSHKKHSIPVHRGFSEDEIGVAARVKMREATRKLKQ